MTTIFGTPSVFTGLTQIPERSDATPGLWNQRFTQIDQNFASAQSLLNSGAIALPSGMSTASLASFLASLGRLYFPENYGAPADGVTDDTPAILRCISAITSSVSRPGTASPPAGKAKTYLHTGGGTVVFTAPKYKINGSVNGDLSGVCLLSLAPNGTVLDGTTSTSTVSAIVEAFNGVGDLRVINFSMQGMSVWGPSGGTVPCIRVTEGFGLQLDDTVTFLGQYGLELVRGSQIQVNRLQIEQPVQDGVRIFGALVSQTVDGVSLNDVWVRSAGRCGYDVLQGSATIQMNRCTALSTGSHGARFYSDQQVNSLLWNSFINDLHCDQTGDTAVLVSGVRWFHINNLWCSNYVTASSHTAHHGFHALNCDSSEFKGVTSYGAKADALRIEGCTDVQVLQSTADDYWATGFNVINSSLKAANVTTRKLGIVASTTSSNGSSSDGVCNYGVAVDATSRVQFANVEAKSGTLSRYSFKGSVGFAPVALTNGWYGQTVSGTTNNVALPSTATLWSESLSNQNVSGDVLMRYHVSTNQAQQTLTGVVKIAYARASGQTVQVKIDPPISLTTVNAASTESITATLSSVVVGGQSSQQTVTIKLALAASVATLGYVRYRLDSLYGLNDTSDSLSNDTAAVITTT